MEVRDGRFARLRRAARGRPLALVTLLYAAAAVVATWPAVGSFTSAFIANDAQRVGEPPAGDHLQSVYRFWLVGHQLEQGGPPWRIPTASSRSSSRRPCSAGGRSACRSGPLNAAFGPVVAWNLLLLGTIVAPASSRTAGCAPSTLAVAPAAIGGLAFALAPYRLEQSAGHLLGWAALFLPLALLAIERAAWRRGGRRTRGARWRPRRRSRSRSRDRCTSGAGSGPLHRRVRGCRFGLEESVHLDAGRSGARGGRRPGCPLHADRGLCRGKRSLLEGAARATRRSRSTSSTAGTSRGARSSSTSAGSRSGWPVAGLIVLSAVAKKPRDPPGPGGLIVPLLFALGATCPDTRRSGGTLPPLHFTASRPPAPARQSGARRARRVRVRGARGARRAAARRRARSAGRRSWRSTSSSSRSRPRRPTPGTAPTGPCAKPPGRVLELPLFGPGQHYASVYDYYRLQEPREHPTGYSTLAPQEALGFYFAYNRLSCGVWLPGTMQPPSRGSGSSVALPPRPLRPGPPAAAPGLPGRARGGRLRRRRHGRRGDALLAGDPPSPATGARAAALQRAVLCSGWRGPHDARARGDDLGLRRGFRRPHLRSPTPVTVRLLADGRLADQRRFGGPVVLNARLEGMRWHALLLDSSAAGIRLDELVF